MAGSSGPSNAARRRLRIAAASVFGIVVIATAVTTARLVATKDTQSVSVKKSAPATAASAVKLPRVKWTLRWSDEFSGHGVPAKWVVASGNGTNGWSHRALQYYRSANVNQDGHGHLVISAAKTGRSTDLTCWNGPCEYTSGRIDSRAKFSQRYGRFAARIKFPVGKGLWPAFWLRAARISDGEIDVIEPVGRKPNTVQGFTHGGSNKGAASIDLSEPLSAGFHVYGVDWTPDGVVWWIDGKPYGAARYSSRRPDQAHWMILNLQVGGKFPKNPDASTHFPARMEVDWVRVYRGAAN